MISSPLLRYWARLFGPRMVYGWRRADGVWLAHTRISTHTIIDHPQKLMIGDHVFIAHFDLLDASGGLKIGDGCQIASYVSILTHSSHRALRIAGTAYWGADDKAPGMVREPTEIGSYCFIGPHSVIAPGAKIGKGVIVSAYSFVRGEVADFSIISGNPTQVIGDTREMDEKLLQKHPEWRVHYEAWQRNL
jgi:acetyltransferase-like isoleucine patch superfamily enzyme